MANKNFEVKHGLSVGGTERITSAGVGTFTDLNVTGTTTTIDTATLQVQDKNIVINYGTGDTSSTASGAGITIQDAVNSSTDATLLWDASADEFDFSHAVTAPSLTIAGNAAFDTSTLVVDSSNNRVGIGTASPSGSLHLSSANADHIYLERSGHDTFRIALSHSVGLGIYNVTDSRQDVMIDGSGNLLVGKTASNIATDGVELGTRVESTADGSYPLRLNRRSSDGDIINLRKDNSVVGSIGANGGRPYLVNNVDGGIHISTDGYGRALVLPADQTGAPEDNLHYLGSSSYRWRDLYLSGTANIDSLVATANGSFVGKFAVKNSGVHGSFDFYNNGTTYLNGTTYVDDVLQVTGSSSQIQLGFAGAGTQQANSEALSIITPASGGGQGIGLKRLDSNTDQGLGQITWSNNTQDGIAKLYVKTDGSVNKTAMVFETAGATGGTVTEKMRIDNVGHVTTPLQPYTAGYDNSGQTVSAVTWTDVAYDTTLESTGTNMRSGTTFTFPVAGVYLVTGVLSIDSAQATNYAQVRAVFGSHSQVFLGLFEKISDNVYGYDVPINFMVKVSANDTMKIQAFSGSGSMSLRGGAASSHIEVMLMG